MTNPQSLVLHQTVEVLVREYQAAEASIQTAFARLEAAEKQINAAFTSGAHREISLTNTRNGSSWRWSDPEEVLKDLRRQCWGVIVERLELRRILSVERIRKLDEQLARNPRQGEEEWPNITEFNVLAFARKHLGSIDTYLKESVEEVFDFLRPRYSKKKTNTQLEVGKKVILEGYVEQSFGGQHFHPHYHQQPRLTSLDRVFMALEGAGSVVSTYRGPLCDAISKAGEDGRGETKYFKFRCFQNGNLHITFTNLELVDKFNKLAGGKRLRPKSAP